MKHNQNHDHGRSHENGHAADPQLVPVRFEFTHPTAATVGIAGTFNDWHPESKAMHPIGNGHWQKETALPPGNYEYCLVVDGRWMPDPMAKETVPNPFGGRNSVLKV
jgi:1,4-alpha-glucan branching enzyme